MKVIGDLAYSRHQQYLKLFSLLLCSREENSIILSGGLTEKVESSVQGDPLGVLRFPSDS